MDGAPAGQPVIVDGADEIEFQIPLAVDFSAQTHQIQVQQTSGNSNTATFTVYAPTIGPQPFNAIQGFDPGGANSNLFTVADVNGDGLADVVMAGPNGTTSLVVMNGQANGQLGPPIMTPGLLAGTMVAGDVNGDGFVDYRERIESKRIARHFNLVERR